MSMRPAACVTPLTCHACRSDCIVKLHEFDPLVLARVDAVFATHRDLRDALLSSAHKLSSCLLYGTQPLLPAFVHYAAWAPFACADMSYEAASNGGSHWLLEGLASRLGLLSGLRRADLHTLASQVEEIGASAWSGSPESTHPSSRRLNRLGAASALMASGHRSWFTSAPGAHLRLAWQLSEGGGLSSGWCNLTAELELIENGWGGWLDAHGYVAVEDAALPTSPTAAVVQTGTAQTQRRPRRARTNLFVDTLPQGRELMRLARSADGEPPGWSPGRGRCPLRTRSWDQRELAYGVAPRGATNVNVIGTSRNSRARA